MTLWLAQSIFGRVLKVRCGDLADVGAVLIGESQERTRSQAGVVDLAARDLLAARPGERQRQRQRQRLSFAGQDDIGVAAFLMPAPEYERRVRAIFFEPESSTTPESERGSDTP